MVALLREFPGVRVTFNLVPSLLVQLEAFAEDRARDRYLELSLKPADELDRRRRRVHRRELLPRAAAADDRRLSRATPSCWRGAARRRRASADGAGGRAALQPRRPARPAGLAQAGVDRSAAISTRDARVRRAGGEGPGLLRGRQGASCASVELEILSRVIPEYRDAAARGQIEISTSPFYHPILPLLCDTDVYLRTHPQSRDAAAAVPSIPRTPPSSSRGPSACHERLFGRRPVGLWPSEGSVSDAMVPLVAAAGFALDGDRRADPRRARSALTLHPRRARPRRAARAALPPVRRAGRRRARSRALFRDHALSDLIGFTYAGWAAEAAADDFVGAARRRPGAGSRRGPAGERRSSRSSSTARTPGSTSRAAAGRSCGRSTGRLPVASRAADGDDGRGVRARPRPS